MKPINPAPDTVGPALVWGEELLSLAGVEPTENDARALLASVLDCPAWQLPLEPARKLGSARARFEDAIRRRAAREPLAYILGEWGFHEIVLATDSRALIPRPETELLVEAALGFDPVPRVCLDLCCGSGAIALALARALPGAWIGASDVSPSALSLATGNARRLGLQDRVEFRLGDLFSPWENKDGFDLVTANPPYIRRTDWEELEPEIREYEPPLALLAGEDGLTVIRRILEAAPGWLRGRGHLLVEIGSSQGSEAAGLARAVKAFSGIRILRDLAGRDRVLHARRKERVGPGEDG